MMHYLAGIVSGFLIIFIVGMYCAPPVDPVKIPDPPPWTICPEDTFGGEDYECPISHPITPGFDKR